MKLASSLRSLSRFKDECLLKFPDLVGEEDLKVIESGFRYGDKLFFDCLKHFAGFCFRSFAVFGVLTYYGLIKVET